MRMKYSSKGLKGQGLKLVFAIFGLIHMPRVAQRTMNINFETARQPAADLICGIKTGHFLPSGDNPRGQRCLFPAQRRAGKIIIRQLSSLCHLSE